MRLGVIVHRIVVMVSLSNHPEQRAHARVDEGRRFALAAAVTVTLLVTLASASKDESQRYVIGETVSQPEAITGAWETQIGGGRTLGLAIRLIATVKSTATTLRGAQQKIRFIRINIYVRNGNDTKQTFWDSDEAGDFSWRNNRLRFYQAARKFYPISVSLDLDFDPVRSEWKAHSRTPIIRATSR